MDTTSGNKMLSKFLQSFKTLTVDEIDEFIALSKMRDFNKGDYFIREGENCKEVAFVLSGIFRSYFISAKGDEITYCITFPNNLMSAYSAFITGQCSTENIQALTSSELLLISKKSIDGLVSKNPNWIKVLKIIAEQQYIELEKRVFQLQKTSALQRYTDLVNNQPEYVQKIPLQYLASYLGITQRHLSRIRKEISF